MRGLRLYGFARARSIGGFTGRAAVFYDAAP
jgi:hypothetical protein